MRQVRVFFHNHCFDGSASAAVFTALYRQERGEAEFSYQGLTHRASGLFEGAEFSGDDNAIVDFKYCADPRVSWWFDHHQSAFLSAADAEHFQHDRSGQKFYDPNYGSCTQFIADIGRKQFGFNPEAQAELIHWADAIDRAQFPSAEAAVQIREPALQLALAIEGSTNPELLQRLIPDYLRAPLAELLQRDYVQRELQPLLDRHWKSLEIIRARLDCRKGVISFDVSDLELEGYNKFIPYFYCPEGVYSVGVSRSQFRTKVSVGTNPWHKSERLINLAELCERYGGGGHARVGAISFAPDRPEQARAAAREVVAYLRQVNGAPE
ncbi:MAG: phosphoesterase [Terriglobales bacterium]